MVLMSAQGRATFIFTGFSSDEGRLAILWVNQFDVLQKEVGILVRKAAERTGKGLHCMIKVSIGQGFCGLPSESESIERDASTKMKGWNRIEVKLNRWTVFTASSFDHNFFLTDL